MVDYTDVMLLAGDVGGTKTLLGLFDAGGERPEAIQVRGFATLEFDSLEDAVAVFLEPHAAARSRIGAACFGVAGPIVDNTARLVNVPWAVDARSLTARFGIARVMLVNDLAAMAYAVPVLRTSELMTVHAGNRVATGNAAVIAAGTGLGQALLHNVDGRLLPSPSEGGHADFAARTAREIELLQFLTRLYGRADWEHVISGPGLANLSRFTHAGDQCAAVGGEGDPSTLPARLTVAAMERRCPACVEALEIFMSAFGAEAGNLALRCVATAGVFIGGGIAPKILPAFQEPEFMQAFVAKAPMEALLRNIPVAVILNQDAGLLGAAVHASAL